MTEAALQYGGIGLAAIVIGLVAVYIRERDKRADERRAQADQFIQQMVQQALATQRESTAAWQKMVELDIAERIKLARALDRVCDRMAISEKQHETMLGVLQGQYLQPGS